MLLCYAKSSYATPHEFGLVFCEDLLPEDGIVLWEL